MIGWGKVTVAVGAVALALSACSAPVADPSTASSAESLAATSIATGAEQVEFTAEVWADNWFLLTVNGVVVGEDSVPITTERSFNAETFTFVASYPLTIALVSNDYLENDSGLEYIGTDRQQLGDGGLIAQFTETATATVVAVTSSAWRGLVIHTAPLNVGCASSGQPEVDCESLIGVEPDGWAEPGFDDSTWTSATEYTVAQVGTKDGFDTIRWDPSSRLIWGQSLTQDNTILWRTEVQAR